MKLEITVCVGALWTAFGGVADCGECALCCSPTSAAAAAAPACSAVSALAVSSSSLDSYKLVGRWGMVPFNEGKGQAG